jgi:hypothetical protein
MRTSTAYFAGVGTVVAAVAAGLGGGLLISNIVNPHAPKIEMSKLELRMSEKPIPATNASSEPAPSVAATTPNTAPTPVQNRPQGEPVTTAPTQPPSPAASPAPTAAPVTQAAASEKASSEQVKTPEAAKPRDAADVKSRDADARREARRAAEEKRKAERRQLWTERRRPRQDQELREVEERVREETEPRQVFSRQVLSREVFAEEPARQEMPRIRLFDLD